MDVRMHVISIVVFVLLIVLALVGKKLEQIWKDASYERSILANVEDSVFSGTTDKGEDVWI